MGRPYRKFAEQRASIRQVFRDQAGAEAVGGLAVQPGPQAAASKADSFWASSPPINPASTSPGAAVAKVGGALAFDGRFAAGIAQ